MSSSVDDVRKNLASVRERIAAAGGDIDRVSIVGVTKTLGVETVLAAVDAGIRAVGENYAQEVVDKASDIDAHVDIGRRRPRWHFIGQLQSNKVKMLAPFIDVWHSVDSVKLVHEIAKRQPQARIFIQVNATDELNRGGCGWHDIDEIVEAAYERELVVQGLMGVGPNGDAELSRPFFGRLVYESRQRDFVDVSCGMSNDFEVAVSEGATVLRLGSALFGPRT